ncbi:MAG TPA: CDP-alcohol phosphatidyltransferase family protein [Syntrophales bacterium]|nr:CDP-alcohol phosphatidyltransferase family protein [Syntrophales bacterium]HRT71685.1 CDP-alcohol phosphatidyltransferase family protein [Syntrophales bacterium]
MTNRTEAGGDVAVILTPDEKGLKKVFGIPAIRRIALLCSRNGFKDIHVVGLTDPFRPILSDLVDPERFHAARDRESMDEIASVIRRSFADAKKVFVTKAGLVVDKMNFLKLTGMRGKNISYMEAGGTGEGMFLCSSQNLAPVLKHLWSPGDCPEILKDAQLVKGSSGLPCALGGDGRDKGAESKLVDAIVAQTKDTDGFFSRHISRHISLLMSTRLALTPIRPNHVTLFGAGTGLLGALFLAQGGYLNQLIGSLLFLLCIIVDGVDGELARLKLQESAFGHKLDIITDNIVHFAIFSGLGWGYYNQTGASAYLYLLLALLGGFILSGAVVYYRILRQPSEGLRPGRLTRFLTLMSNRDFAYLMVLLAVFGRLDWFLIGAAAGSYIFAAVLWVATCNKAGISPAMQAGSEADIP